VLRDRSGAPRAGGPSRQARRVQPVVTRSGPQRASVARVVRDEDLPAAVVAAGLADGVRADHRSAVRAAHQLGARKRVVRATVAALRPADLSLRSCHGWCLGRICSGRGPASLVRRPKVGVGTLRTAAPKSTTERDRRGPGLGRSYGRKPACCNAECAASTASPTFDGSLPLPCAPSGRPPPPPPISPANSLTSAPACTRPVSPLSTETTTITASGAGLMTTPASGPNFCWARLSSSCASLVCRPGRS